MNDSTPLPFDKNDSNRLGFPLVSIRQIVLVIVLVAIAAAPGVFPFAGSWNDGSRLAAIESLSERNTWILDESLFVFPSGPKSGVPNPYDPASPGLAQRGTLDLMQIDGHFYSDKSPVPTVFLAGTWKVLRLLGAPSPQENPGFFCWMMGWMGAVWPLAFGVGAVWALAAALTKDQVSFWWVFLGGTLATMAPCYSRSINTHIMMWAVSAWVTLCLTRMSGELSVARQMAWGLFLGTILGLGYGVDLGIGPALTVASGAWLILGWGLSRWLVLVGMMVGFFPWFLLHHGIGYALAGTWGPMNANPAFFQWPGSPFDEKSLTGGFKHPGWGKFLLYSGDMLFGKKGILFHEGLGLLGFLGLCNLIKPAISPSRGLTLFNRAFFLLAFLVYALGSNNQSGLCRSVRWFLPLALPLWYFATLAINGCETRWAIYRGLVVLGVPVAVLAFLGGPWEGSVLAGYWVFAGFQIVGGLWAISSAFPRKTGKTDSTLSLTHSG